MKAAIALPSDHHIQNVARRMVYEINRYTGIKFLGSLLPAHASLKQPFTFEDMDDLENWFASFCRQIMPVRIDLERVYMAEYSALFFYAMGPSVQDPSFAARCCR